MTELMASIVYASNAKKVWSEFEERIDRSNLTRIFHLWTEIATLRQGTDSVTSYYSKMNDFLDELDVLAPLPSCDCEESLPYVAHLRSQRLLQFLMGLNESYSNLRSNMLARRPIVSVNEAYATDFKSKKKSTQFSGFRPFANSTVAGENVNSSEGQGHFFTEQQYKQILNMMNKPTSSDSADNITGNMADIGASYHITPYKELLTTFRTLRDQNTSRVQVLTGDRAEIISIRDALILGSYKLENVLHVPYFKFNLLSVSKITKQLSCVVLFFPDFCVFQGLFNGKVMGIDKEKEGLYILQEAIKPAVGATVHKEDNGEKLWHWRLGRPSIGEMQHIADVKNKVDVELLECCEICPLAKQSRIKFPTSNSRSSSLFQLMHLDVWSPYRKPTYDKMHYFVTIVDDYSMCTWIYLIQSKCEVFVVLKNFFALIKNQFDKNIKILRSDNGSEFFNTKYCVRTVVYLINRFPSTVLQGKTPFELLHDCLEVTNSHRELGRLYLWDIEKHRKVTICISQTHAGDSHAQHPTSAELIPEPGEEMPRVESSTIDSPNLSDAAPDIEDVVDQPQTHEAPTTAVFDQAETHPVELTTKAYKHHEQHDSVQAHTQRRPSRTIRPLIWLSDYITTVKPKAHCSYPISQYVTYTHLTPTY
ncbi:uncharacterized protein LOC107815453 [Nicotiana tabacum]|uniref:Uncharacterized protein LOC107815453 n=1 Tax=Nicotiana tabacum TaxID=4097 RepID=A0AC58T3Z4_TOBAC